MTIRAPSVEPGALDTSNTGASGSCSSEPFVGITMPSAFHPVAEPGASPSLAPSRDGGAPGTCLDSRSDGAKAAHQVHSLGISGSVTHPTHQNIAGMEPVAVPSAAPEAPLALVDEAGGADGISDRQAVERNRDLHAEILALVEALHDFERSALLRTLDAAGAELDRKTLLIRQLENRIRFQNELIGMMRQTLASTRDEMAEAIQLVRATNGGYRQ